VAKPAEREPERTRSGARTRPVRETVPPTADDDDQAGPGERISDEGPRMSDEQKLSAEDAAKVDRHVEQSFGVRPPGAPPAPRTFFGIPVLAQDERPVERANVWR
jgi:hypothetical protein